MPGPKPLREAEPPGPRSPRSLRGWSQSLQPPPLCRARRRGPALLDGPRSGSTGPSHRAEAPEGLRCSPCSPPWPCGHVHLAGLHKACPLPGAGTSAHFQSPPRAAHPHSPQDTRSGPAAGSCSLTPTCCAIQGASPTPQSLDLCPENISQKHKDTRPSHQPPPQPLPSTAQKRRATSNFSLGPQPWSSGEPQRQTSPRGTTSPGPLRGTALSWDAGGATLVCRGGVGTASAPWGCFSDKWGLISLTGPSGPTVGTDAGSGPVALSRPTMDGRRYLYWSVERLLPVSRELLRWQK